MFRPCPHEDCGELTENTYCDNHKPVYDEVYKQSPEAMGYDYAWRKLSKKARKLSPFCEDCNTTRDLTTDHSPEAWVRKQAGKPIRLEDVSVVCRSCNSKRGEARSGITPDKASDSGSPALVRVFSADKRAGGRNG